MSTGYWCEDNGAITCEAHAGNYLTCAIKARPRAKSHRTPLGRYTMLSEEEMEECLTYLRIMERKHLCEMCDHLEEAGK